MRGWTRSVADFIAEKPILDSLVAVLVSAGYALIEVRSHSDFLTTLGPEGRAVFYQTASGVAAGLFAVVFTAVAIVLAVTPGPRLSAMLNTHPAFFRHSLHVVVRSLAAATGTITLAGALDQPGSLDQWVRTVVVTAVVIILFRIARLIWLFGRLLTLIVNDVSQPNATEVPRTFPTGRQAVSAPPRRRIRRRPSSRGRAK